MMEVERVSNVVPLILIFACGTLFLFLLFEKKRNRAKNLDEVCRDLSLIPCPNKSFIPFLGNSLELLPIKNYFKVFSEWGKTYRPIFCVKGFGNTLVYLNSAPYVQALLKSTNMDHLNKCGAVYNLAKIAFPTGKGMVFADNTYWKPQRKLLNKLMTRQHLVSYMSLLNKAGGRLVDVTEKQFADGKHNEIIDLITESLFHTIFELCTGFDLYGTQVASEFHQAIKTLMSVFGTRLTKPWLQPECIWKLHSASKLETNAVETTKKHLNFIIEKYKKQQAQKNIFETETKTNLLNELISEGLSDNVIRDELKVMITGGHDTSAFAITMTCLLLALNPQYQEKCFQEIAQTWILEERPFELRFDNLPDLKYLEWCILEAMRLFPPVFFYARELHSPLKLDNKLELPSGTNVAVLPFLLHKNEEYFPKSEKFDPLRFSPEESGKRHPYAYIPFSAGSRNCYGYKFAMMQMKVSMAYLLRNFVITTPEAIDSVGMLPNFLMTPERNHLFKLDRRTI